MNGGATCGWKMSVMIDVCIDGFGAEATDRKKPCNQFGKAYRVLARNPGNINLLGGTVVGNTDSDHDMLSVDFDMWLLFEELRRHR